MPENVRRWRPQCGLVLAAIVASFAPVPAWTDDATLIDAVELIRRNRDTEAVEVLQRLAERGDSRAQYLLGLAYLEGKLVPRDLVLGYAWLQVAAAGYNGSSKRGAADEAQSAMLEVGPTLSGAALIQAEQKAAALIKAREDQLASDTQRATEALKSPETSAGRVLSGCALEPTLSGCKSLAGAAKEIERCTGDIVSPDVAPSTQGPTASIGRPEYPKEGPPADRGRTGHGADARRPLRIRMPGDARTGQRRRRHRRRRPQGSATMATDARHARRRTRRSHSYIHGQVQYRRDGL